LLGTLHNNLSLRPLSHLLQGCRKCRARDQECAASPGLPGNVAVSCQRDCQALAHISHRVAEMRYYRTPKPGASEQWGLAPPKAPGGARAGGSVLWCVLSHPLRLARAICAVLEQAGEKNTLNFRYLYQHWGQRRSHVKHGTQASGGGRHGRWEDFRSLTPVAPNSGFIPRKAKRGTMRPMQLALANLVHAPNTDNTQGLRW